MIDPARTLFRIRLALAVFILGLVVSGVTAFPLTSEIDLLARLTGADAIADSAGQTGFLAWVAHVRGALHNTYSAYPFMAYGTDWLAFGHLIIALFFLGPLVDPVRNIFVMYAGLAACVLVIPLALIAGQVREVPFYWRLVDCSFGVGGFMPLWYALTRTKTLAAASYTRFIIPTGGR